ncbi:MAG: hypothetical protein V3V00_10085 [Saprospiraceae bacterium]
MHNSKLVNLLFTLDKPTWSKCKNIVQNQYRDTSNERKMFEYFYKYRNDLKHKNITKKAVFAHITPKGTGHTFKNTTSRLCKTIEDFVIHDELDHENYLWNRQYILSRYYKKKGMNKHFLAEINSAIDREAKESDYSIFKNIRQFLLLHEAAFSEIDSEKMVGYFNKSIGNLSKFYHNMKTLYEVEEECGNNLFNKGLKTKPDPDDNVLTEFTSHMMKLVQRKSDSSFKILRNQLESLSTANTEMLAQLTLTYLINHCYYKIKQGEDAYAQEVLDLYDHGLNSNILLSYGKISETGFLNIVEVKTKFAPKINHQNFVDQWIDLVETDHISTVKNIAEAYILFSSEKYKETFRLLNNMVTQQANTNLYLRARWMTICCSYSLYEKYGNLIKVLDTHRRFFTRHKKEMSRESHLGSMNLIKVIKMLRKGMSKLEIQKFVESTPVMMRYWINKEIKKCPVHLGTGTANGVGGKLDSSYVLSANEAQDPSPKLS